MNEMREEVSCCCCCCVSLIVISCRTMKKEWKKKSTIFLHSPSQSLQQKIYFPSLSENIISNNNNSSSSKLNWVEWKEYERMFWLSSDATWISSIFFCIKCLSLFPSMSLESHPFAVILLLAVSWVNWNRENGNSRNLYCQKIFEDNLLL